MKLAAMLTENLLDDDIISKKEANIINYGLENLIGNLAGLIIILTIGAFFHHIRDSFLVWVLAFPLRKYAGGFHAKTRGRCFLLSVGMILISYVIFFQYKWNAVAISCITLSFSILIFFLAPVGNPNKPLDTPEQKMYRIKTREFLLLDIILFCTALYFEWENLTIAITICFFMVGISLLAGKTKYELEQFDSIRIMKGEKK